MGLMGFPLNKGKGETFLRFSQLKVFLIETYVAGTAYIPEMETLEPRLKLEARLQMIREPSNPFDPLAIRFQNEDGCKIGYVPRRKNEILAHLMDAGKSLYALISKKEKDGEWTQIYVHIFMEDF